jgi:transcriptional regulator with PAS, ATPase and Fis domain
MFFPFPGVLIRDIKSRRVKGGCAVPEGLNFAAPPGQSIVRSDLPRYFHLLWDEDLEAMRDIFRAIRDRRSEVIKLWYQLYAIHFGDARTLSENDFFRVFEPALLHNKNHLLALDMERYAQDVRALGEQLAERAVPLQEIIASLQLYEQAAISVFPENLPQEVDFYMTFDRLSHVRIMLIVDAYMRVATAVQESRVRRLEWEAARLPHDERTTFFGLVGRSAVMRRLYERITAAAKTRGTVLIVGESGTGKELVARALHEAGGRTNAPFVAFNCAAIPKDLIESELFGYKRGAFSGANTDYLGLFRAADGGTLFLDEITEMSPETQAKLLRAMQERSVRPIGTTSEVPVDARLIASTNRDPEEAVRDRVLREDLYYRLQASVLPVPPLREHLDDVPLLVEHFIGLFNERLDREIRAEGIEVGALETMQRYDWPGNVRELANAIESAMTFGQGPLIRLADLPAKISSAGHSVSNLRSAVQETPVGSTFAEVERDLIRRALEMCGWNKVHAAAMLKISRKKLYAKINKYQLEEP